MKLWTSTGTRLVDASSRICQIQRQQKLEPVVREQLDGRCVSTRGAGGGRGPSVGRVSTPQWFNANEFYTKSNARVGSVHKHGPSPHPWHRQDLLNFFCWRLFFRLGSLLPFCFFNLSTLCFLAWMRFVHVGGRKSFYWILTHCNKQVLINRRRRSFGRYPPLCSDGSSAG